MTGIFRDFFFFFFCFNGEEGKRERRSKKGREKYIGRKRMSRDGKEGKGKKEGGGITNAHRFVMNRFAMNRDFIGFN